MKHFLVDTNIILEILLEQEKKDACKQFLNTNREKLYISDFSLHSIGVLLFRYKKTDIFKKFLEDVLPEINLVTLPKAAYKEIVILSKKYKLDFDDSYQVAIAKEYKFSIGTMDRDFNKASDELDVVFL